MSCMVLKHKYTAVNEMTQNEVGTLTIILLRLKDILSKSVFETKSDRKSCNSFRSVFRGQKPFTRIILSILQSVSHFLKAKDMK